MSMNWETREEKREWMKKLGEIFKQGPDAVIRLQAEVLLNRADNDEFKLTDEEREKIDHIAVVGTEDDREYLETVYEYLEVYRFE